MPMTDARSVLPTPTGRNIAWTKIKARKIVEKPFGSLSVSHGDEKYGKGFVSIRIAKAASGRGEIRRVMPS